MEIKNYPEISQDALKDTLVIDQGTKTTFMQFKTLNANPTKWSNTLKQFVGNLPTNCLCVLHHFVGLVLKGLRQYFIFIIIPSQSIRKSVSSCCLMQQ